MARTQPSSFVPLAAQSFAPSRSILEGSASGYAGPLDLGENINYLWADGVRPIHASNQWNASGAGYVAGKASGSEVIQGLWTREPSRQPFTQYRIHVVYENTGATTPGDDGVARFDLGSDPYVAPSSGTYIDINLRGNSTQWQVASDVLTLDASQTTDTIRMWLVNGASGAVRVQSVCIYPEPLSSIPAGSVTPSDGNSHRFVPHDSNELDADSPWSVHQANTMINNLETIRKTRPDCVVSYCCDPSATGRAALETSSSSYQIMRRIPFFAGPGQTSIRWSVIAKRDGTSGSVRLSTGYMTAKETAAQTISLGSTWSSPYTAATTLYSAGGQAALDCGENTLDWLTVELQGDGTTDARLYGLCAWFAPVA